MYRRLISLILWSATASTAQAGSPFFSTEIQALIEPCPAMLLREGLMLSHLDSSVDSAEVLRARLEQPDIVGRFHERPRFSIALTVTDPSGLPLPRPENRSTQWVASEATLFLALADAEDIEKAVQLESRNALGFAVEDLEFRGASFVSRSDDEISDFVFHIRAQIVLKPSRDPSAREKTALAYFQRGILDQELRLQAATYAGREQLPKSQRNYLRTEQLAFSRAAMEFERLDQILQNAGSILESAVMTRPQKDNPGFGVRFEERAGRREMVITRGHLNPEQTDPWYWRVGLVPEGGMISSTSGPVRRLIHLDTNGTLKDIESALPWVNAFFPKRAP